MQYIIIPTEKLKTFDADWETRRKSNDGTKAIIHKEIYDKYFPEESKPLTPSARPLKAQPRMARMAMPMMAMAAPMEVGVADLPEKPEERVYPYPLASGEEINAMEEFQSKEGI